MCRKQGRKQHYDSRHSPTCQAGSCGPHAANNSASSYLANREGPQQLPCLPGGRKGIIAALGGTLQARAESGSTHLEVGPEASGKDGDGQVQGCGLLVLALPLLKGLLLLARQLQIRHHALHLRTQAFNLQIWKM